MAKDIGGEGGDGGSSTAADAGDSGADDGAAGGDGDEEFGSGIRRVSPTAIKDAGENFLKKLAKGKGAADDSGSDDDDDDSGADDGDDDDDDAERGKKGKFAQKGTTKVVDDDADDDADADEDEDEDSRSKKDDGDADDEDEDKDDDDKGEEKPKANRVVLAGLEDRGEEDLEIEIDDPEVLARIRRLQNDSMRGKVFREKMQGVRAREAELRDIDLMIEHNPHGFLFEEMPKERQVEIAEALLAEHWDDLQPIITEFVDDPAKASKVRADTVSKMRQGDKDLAKKRQNLQFADDCRMEVEKLIPDGVAPDTVAAFLRDAERDLIDAVRRGELRSPSDVPRFLAERIRMYGFGKGDRSRRSTAKGRPDSRAETADQKRRRDAEEHQDRVKRGSKVRRASRGIVAGGRGTATTRKPLVPRNASIEEASEKLKNSGDSWDDFNGKVN